MRVLKDIAVQLDQAQVMRCIIDALGNHLREISLGGFNGDDMGHFPIGTIQRSSSRVPVALECWEVEMTFTAFTKVVVLHGHVEDSAYRDYGGIIIVLDGHNLDTVLGVYGSDNREYVIGYDPDSEPHLIVGRHRD